MGSPAARAVCRSFARSPALRLILVSGYFITLSCLGLLGYNNVQIKGLSSTSEAPSNQRGAFSPLWLQIGSLILCNATVRTAISYVGNVSSST